LIDLAEAKTTQKQHTTETHTHTHARTHARTHTHARIHEIFVILHHLSGMPLFSKKPTDSGPDLSALTELYIVGVKVGS